MNTLLAIILAALAQGGDKDYPTDNNDQDSKEKTELSYADLTEAYKNQYGG